MQKYLVITEARERGAIGIFYPVSFKVRASSPERAREHFIELVRCFSNVLRNYEFNSIKEVKPLN